MEEQQEEFVMEEQTNETTDSNETKKPNWFRRNTGDIIFWSGTFGAAVASAVVIYTMQKKQAYGLGHSYGEGVGDAMTEKAEAYRAIREARGANRDN